VAVHAGSLIGSLKESHRFLLAPPPYDFGGAERQRMAEAASPWPAKARSISPSPFPFPLPVREGAAEGGPGGGVLSQRCATSTPFPRHITGLYVPYPRTSGMPRSQPSPSPCRGRTAKRCRRPDSLCGGVSRIQFFLARGGFGGEMSKSSSPNHYHLQPSWAAHFAFSRVARRFSLSLSYPQARFLC
jgi:hypothetical protein